MPSKRTQNSMELPTKSGFYAVRLADRLGKESQEFVLRYMPFTQHWYVLEALGGRDVGFVYLFNIVGKGNRTDFAQLVSCRLATLKEVVAAKIAADELVCVEQKPLEEALATP